MHGKIFYQKVVKNPCVTCKREAGAGNYECYDCDSRAIKK